MEFRCDRLTPCTGDFNSSGGNYLLLFLGIGILQFRNYDGQNSTHNGKRYSETTTKNLDIKKIFHKLYKKEMVMGRIIWVARFLG